MKKIYLAVLTLLSVPILAQAAGSVYVYPQITNAHGGTLYAADLYTTITYQNGTHTQSQTGVPTYDLSDASSDPTDYTVTGNPPYPYTYTLDSGCSGIVSSGERKVCNIYWEDNATKPVPVKPQAVAPGAQPSQSVIPAPVVQTQLSVPTIVQDDSAEIQRLQLQLIDLLNQLIQLLTLKAHMS